MYAEDTDACAEGAENGCSPCYLNCSTGDCIGGMAGEGQGLFVAPLPKACIHVRGCMTWSGRGDICRCSSFGCPRNLHLPLSYFKTNYIIFQALCIYR